SHAAPEMRCWRSGERLDSTRNSRSLSTCAHSLINGCVYCIDLHRRQGLRAGEEPVRLFALAARRGWSPFSAREPAALAVTDAATRVSRDHVPDEVWKEAARHFAPPELAQLIWTIGAINMWNRIAICTPWGALTWSHAAAASYSWMSPPRRSRRRMAV